MRYTHLARHILALGNRYKQKDLAKITGMHQAALSNFITRGGRPSVETLNRFCTKLPNPRDGLDLLIAHLHDEIDRSGRSKEELKITPCDMDTEDMVKILVTESAYDPDIRFILEHLANVCRQHPHSYIEAEEDESEHFQEDDG